MTGIIEFFILVLVVVICAAITVWAIGAFAPGTPAIVPKLVWALAVVIIIYTLAQAVGLFSHDVAIPRLR
jgi:hypothetical protein